MGKRVILLTERISIIPIARSGMLFVAATLSHGTTVGLPINYLHSISEMNCNAFYVDVLH